MTRQQLSVALMILFVTWIGYLLYTLRRQTQVPVAPNWRQPSTHTHVTTPPPTPSFDQFPPVEPPVSTSSPLITDWMSSEGEYGHSVWVRKMLENSFLSEVVTPDAGQVEDEASDIPPCVPITIHTIESLPSRGGVVSVVVSVPHPGATRADALGREEGEDPAPLFPLGRSVFPVSVKILGIAACERTHIYYGKGSCTMVVPPRSAWPKSAGSQREVEVEVTSLAKQGPPICTQHRKRTIVIAEEERQSGMTPFHRDKRVRPQIQVTAGTLTGGWHAQDDTGTTKDRQGGKHSVSRFIWGPHADVYVEGTVSVPAGETMFVFEGTHIFMKPGARIELESDSQLQLLGEVDIPILVTIQDNGQNNLNSPAEWGWGGIVVEPRAHLLMLHTYLVAAGSRTSADSTDITPAVHAKASTVSVLGGGILDAHGWAFSLSNARLFLRDAIVARTGSGIMHAVKSLVDVRGSHLLEAVSSGEMVYLEGRFGESDDDQTNAFTAQFASDSVMEPQVNIYASSVLMYGAGSCIHTAKDARVHLTRSVISTLGLSGLIDTDWKDTYHADESAVKQWLADRQAWMKLSKKAQQLLPYPPSLARSSFSTLPTIPRLRLVDVLITDTETPVSWTDLFLASPQPNSTIEAEYTVLEGRSKLGPIELGPLIHPSRRPGLRRFTHAQSQFFSPPFKVECKPWDEVFAPSFLKPGWLKNLTLVKPKERQVRRRLTTDDEEGNEKPEEVNDVIENLNLTTKQERAAWKKREQKQLEKLQKEKLKEKERAKNPKEIIEKRFSPAFIHFKIHRFFINDFQQLHPSLGKRSELMVRALVELLSYLDHPSVVPVVDFCGNYKVEPVRGDSGEIKGHFPSFRWSTVLNDGFKDYERVTIEDPKKKLLTALNLARAVAYLHTSPIGTVFHNDMKPSNVLVKGDGGGAVGVIDLDTAILRPHDQVIMPEPHPFCCSPGYIHLSLACEMCQPITPKSDVYSLGLHLNFILGNRNHISRLDRYSKKSCKGNNCVPDLSSEEVNVDAIVTRSIRSNFGDDVANAVKASLALDEKNRITAREVADILERRYLELFPPSSPS